jgi:hypothetical protein
MDGVLPWQAWAVLSAIFAALTAGRPILLPLTRR